MLYCTYMFTLQVGDTMLYEYCTYMFALQVGDSMLADIEQKLDKLQEPPPVKAVKPLPAPVEVPRKKRGGRRSVH